MKTLAATVAALAFTASAALAQDDSKAFSNGLPDDSQSHPYRILSEDDGVLVLSQDFAAAANSYILLCPGYGLMRDLYTSNPDAAVMIVWYEDRDALTETLSTVYSNAIKSLWEGFDKTYGPTYNNGMIAADGTVLPHHSDQDMFLQGMKTLQIPGGIPAAPLDSGENVRKMRNYAENYCFARY